MKIGEHFRDNDGRPEWHFPIIFADELGKWGFPPLSILERCAWSYLFFRLGEGHHPCSANEVARRVWGSTSHKNTANRTLKALLCKGLVRHIDDGFEAVVPALNDTPPALNDTPPALPSATHDPALPSAPPGAKWRRRYLAPPPALPSATTRRYLAPDPALPSATVRTRTKEHEERQQPSREAPKAPPPSEPRAIAAAAVLKNRTDDEQLVRIADSPLAALLGRNGSGLGRAFGAVDESLQGRAPSAPRPPFRVCGCIGEDSACVPCDGTGFIDNR